MVNAPVLLRTGFAILTAGALFCSNCDGHSQAAETENLRIIKGTYEGRSSQENGRNLAKYLHRDAIWIEAAGFPYGGTYTGIEEVTTGVFERLGSEWIDYKFSVEDYVASGDRVFAYGTYSGTYRATDKTMRARVAHLWTLRDGKIVRFEQFVDSHSVQKAMK